MKADSNSARRKTAFKETCSGQQTRCRIRWFGLYRAQCRTRAGRTRLARARGDQAAAALDDLLSLPLVVYPTAPLLARAWELRHNLTVYDGCYVALAEALEAPLVTADRRLFDAPGPRCEIELV